MRHRVDFTAVIHKLGVWREAAVAQLREPQTHTEGFMLKHQLDAAIATLEFCQHFQIKPDAHVTVLPDLKTMTPSCAYRVLEDNETDNQAHWIELEIEGEHLELLPGDIVIEQGKHRKAS